MNPERLVCESTPSSGLVDPIQWVPLTDVALRRGLMGLVNWTEAISTLALVRCRERLPRFHAMKNSGPRKWMQADNSDPGNLLKQEDYQNQSVWHWRHVPA